MGISSFWAYHFFKPLQDNLDKLMFLYVEEEFTLKPSAFKHGIAEKDNLYDFKR